MFDESEKAFLRDLKASSTWHSILKKLADSRRAVPAYKPGKDAPAGQERDWVYYSGVDRGANDLLKLLANE